MKNGWLLESGSGWHVNTIGYVTESGHEYAMAVLSDGSATMAAGVDAVEDVARTAHTALH